MFKLPLYLTECTTQIQGLRQPDMGLITDWSVISYLSYPLVGWSEQ